VTFENVQAGERTSHLFRLANLHGGRVVGTSDLSELALGYTTYGVGDHMAHYSVNASELIRWTAHADERSAPTRDVLAILATTISPELVPGSGEAPAQSAEAERPQCSKSGDQAETSATEPARAGKRIPTTACGTGNLRPWRTFVSDSALAQKSGHYVQNELSVSKAIRSGAYLRQPSAVPIRSSSMRGRIGRGRR
jgi:hypothetical protein